MSLIDVSNVNKNVIHLENRVITTNTTKNISSAFDYEFDGTRKTDIYIPNFPKSFQIGLIVGSSGSGKSTLLKLFGEEENIQWDNKYCIADNFDSCDDAIGKLGAVGLNSIPSWLQSYNTLSNGEKFRADVARRLKDNAVIDEFTSVVNRECAISCSSSVQKYIRNNDLQNIVFCSCHFDIIDYLQPDWVYNTDSKALSVGRSERQRQNIILEINQCSKQVWDMFKKHHYLSADLNKSADCYCVSWNSCLVAFGAILPMPGKFGNDTRKCVSEHRIVVLPDYQGIGIGNRFSEYLGELYLSYGYRYFGKTANPRMGEHRNKSDRWKSTSTNMRKTKSLTDSQIDSMIRSVGRNTSAKSVINYYSRLCYSHEYIGDSNRLFDDVVLKNKRSRLF